MPRVQARLLRSERRQAYRWPESRELRGSDSQVVLGCTQKGRSSSLALNSLLKQSIPTVTGGDVTSEGFYVNTDLNSADDPTRGSQVRSPDMHFPSWWHSLAGGEFGDFDKWLSKAGHSLSSQLGIPEPSELMESALVEALPRADGPADLSGSVSKKPPCLGPEGSSVASITPEPAQRDSEVPKHRQPISIFTEGANQILKSFDSSHFVWPRDDERKSGGVREWALCLDLCDGPQSDLLDVELRGKVEELIRQGVFGAIGAAPACASFSIAVAPPVRSCLHPQGLPDLRESMVVKVSQDNSFSSWLTVVAALCIERGIVFWVENPLRSWLWAQPEWADLRSRDDCGFWDLTFCFYGARWKKPTRVFTNGVLRGSKDSCPGCSDHISLRGYSRMYKKPWTKVAEPYKGSQSGWAQWHILRPEDRLSCLDVAECAKVSNRNIGEAKRPGPWRASGLPRIPRDINLDDVQLVSAQTEQLQNKIWSRFHSWVASGTSLAAGSAFQAEPLLLCILVSEFGRCLFGSGESLYLFRHLILAALKHCPGARQHISECWTLVSKWELVEPLQHRAPFRKSYFVQW